MGLVTAPSPPRVQTRGATSRGFAWAAVALSGWVVSGAYLDAWAHMHNPELETFFTPWHGVLYSGLLAVSLLLGSAAARGVRRGRPLRTAMPAGYGLSLLGCLTFSLFGLADMVWHLVFGIEQGIAALLSPTHLGLMVSAGLIVSAPWRAAVAAGDRRAGYAVVLSGAFVVALLWFFLQFAVPYGSAWSANRVPAQLRAEGTAKELGVLGLLVAAAALTAVVVALVRDFRLPPGSMIILVGAPAFSIVAAVGPEQPAVMVLGALAGGAVADLLLAALVRPQGPEWGVRLFAALFPVAVWSSYFAAVQIAYGVWWEVHVWTGVITASGILGWLLACLVTAPLPSGPLPSGPLPSGPSSRRPLRTVPGD